MKIDQINLLEEMQHYDADKALQAVEKRISVKCHASWRYTLQEIAASLLIPVLLGSASYIWYTSSNETPSQLVWQTVETQPGQRSVVELSDGTRVWLNSATKLTYPVTFDKKNRDVKLIGEAFFDVSRMEKKPFRVDLGDLNIKVLGTEFNVHNYPAEEKTRVFLKSGSVELYSGEEDTQRSLYKMNPGERAVFDNGEHGLFIEKGHPELCMAWMDGKMVFRGNSMTEVVMRLNRNFNIDIRIIDPEIADYTYTATFQHESLEQILELLKISAPIDYTIAKREKDENNMFTKTRVEIFTRH